MNAFTCSADSFERARLEATAAFEGGDEQTRRYRITLVDGHEQVLSERFDALLALDDDFSQCLEEEAPLARVPHANRGPDRRGPASLRTDLSDRGRD